MVVGGPATLGDAVNGDLLITTTNDGDSSSDASPTDDGTCPVCGAYHGDMWAMYGTNPIEEFVQSTAWTRDDLELALSALGITLSLVGIYLATRD